MNTNIDTLVTAVAGTSAVAVAGIVNLPTPDEVQSVGQLLIQAIIAVITVWKLIKKPKTK